MAVKETLSYSDGVKGWPSFYSFLPDFMIGMNSYLYTFNGGNLYRHNTNALRNNYYGVQYNSNITSVFNVGVSTFSSKITIRVVVGTLPAAKAFDTIVVAVAVAGKFLVIKT